MMEQKFDPVALRNLQGALGHQFRNKRLLFQALTHSSYAHCQGDLASSNERLEFLGDAVLELCVSVNLYRMFPQASEGELTAMRAALVNGRALGEIAAMLGIADLALKSVGAEWQGEKQRQNLGADALEALLAAVWLEGGLEAAQKAVATLFEGKWPESPPAQKPKNAKNQLQEETMRLFHALPAYRAISEAGPEHVKTFGCLAILPDGREFYGEGANRKSAEQMAAAAALAALEADCASGG